LAESLVTWIDRVDSLEPIGCIDRNAAWHWQVDWT